MIVPLDREGPDVPRVLFLKTTTTNQSSLQKRSQKPKDLSILVPATRQAKSKHLEILFSLS